MKISELDLKWITLIQVLLALIITLIFQFIIPFNWQPLDRMIHGPDIQHGDQNYVFFTISQWYFSMSIAWLLYRDNPYINNFIVYSIISLSMIIIIEVSTYGLFWDYIHVVPFIVDIFILWKKRETLHQNWYFYYWLLGSIWLFSVYFLRLAYYEDPLDSYIIKYILITICGIALSFSFRGNRFKFRSKD